jgi:ceruloplasmin
MSCQVGVDREFYLNWMVIDENLSWYIDDNIKAFTTQPYTVNKQDPQFQLSNRMRCKKNIEYLSNGLNDIGVFQSELL